MAQGDPERAARYLMALFGAEGDQAEAGALLLWDALVSLRGLEEGSVKWKHGRPGL